MTSRFVSSLLSTIKRALNLIYRPVRDGVKEDVETGRDGIKEDGETGRDGLKDDVETGRDGLKEDAEKLNSRLRRVQATVEELEHRDIHDETIKLWLQELKCVASDAEDVLDEYHYELLRCQLEVEAAVSATPFGKVGSMVYNSGPNTAMESGASSCFSESISAEMIEKIRKINCKFDEIKRDRKALRLKSKEGKRREPAPSINVSISSHLMNKDDIFGRSDDKKKIINLLLSGISGGEERKDQFEVIPILGMGGIGKTTLAQMVYDDPSVQSMFDVMAWVYVSPEFDIVRLTKEISEFVTGKPGGSFDGLSKIQEVIQKELVGKKMILVLDDVWNMQRYDWDKLVLPLRVAKLVRVLVTSRNDFVAQALHTVTPHRLHVLPQHECWKLFQHCAFDGNIIAKTERSEKIGRKIIKKCGGLPLAVKCIGGVLRYIDKDSWKEILYSELWESDELNSVFRALKVSYYHLPHKLRDCFLFCSLFPKGSRLRRIEIIYMWMAHGFLQPKFGEKKAEDLGDEYLDELQMRSFILRGAKGSFILHDVMYDLARSLSVGEIDIIMDEKSSHLSDKIRHLYIKRGNKPCKSFKPRCLRTLFNGSYIDLADILSVRVLGLIGFNVYAYTNSAFCRLKHLRYLAIKEVDLETLPDSVCLLYNLQTLKLSHCNHLRELPSNISNLVNLSYLHIAHVAIEELPSMLWQVNNLRRLHLEECGHLKFLPPDISNLTNLQTLRLKSCKNLLELPSDIGNLVNLNILDLSFSGIRTLPPSLGLVLNTRKLELVGACWSTSLSLDQVMRMAIDFNAAFCEDNKKNVMVLVCQFKTTHKVIDISEVSGYNELARNFALAFGIQGLLHEIPGWKITYYRSLWDREFLFGSESWQDFVKSVRIIKITGPKECNARKSAEISGSGDTDNTWMTSRGSTMESMPELS